MEHNITILIVEDEALIAQRIKMQLEDFGYHIAAVCYDYISASKAIGQLQFDVLLTDINLGYGIDTKSGLQLAGEVRLSKNCPIIFLTAFSDVDTIKKATALLPAAYLVKPVNAANRFAAVQVAVENYSNNTLGSTDAKQQVDYFFVKQGTKYIKLFWKNVYHLEAVKNYVKVATSEYGGSFLISGSLQQVMQNMLPPSFKENFIKINRAEAIAKHIVLKFDSNTVETTYGVFLLTGIIGKNEW